MRATRLWARVLVRKHWRATLLLGVLCGLAAGAAGAGWAAARTTANAFPTFVAAHRGPAFGVYVCPSGKVLDAVCSRTLPTRAQRAAILRVPGVAAVARGSSVVGRVRANGTDRLALVTALADRPSRAGNSGLLLSGTTPVPLRPGDMVVNESAARQYGLQAGDRVTFVPFLEDQAGAADNAGTPQGPPLRGTVVGVVRQPGDLTANARGANQTDMAMYVPRGWWLEGAHFYRYGALTATSLVEGADAAAVKRGIRAAVPGEAFIESADTANVATVYDAIDYEVWAARVFALVVALSALLLLGQAIVRQVGRESDDAPVLRSMGLTRREFAFATGLRWGATGAVGVVTAAAVLVASSPVAPIGLARRTIEHATVHVDALVMSVTVVGTLALVVAFGTFAGWRAATRDRRRVAVVSFRSTRSLGPAAATGIRATIAGLRRPLRSNTGSAVGTIVMITMAAVASAALVASYDRVVREPTRFGASWDAVVGNNGSLAEADQVAAALSDVDGVGGAAGILDLSGSLVGREEVPLISFLPVRGQAHTLGPVIVEGRAPTRAGEVALASVSMRRLGLSIGDRVTIRVPATPLGPVHARVVGRAVVNNTYGLEPGVGGVIGGRWAQRLATSIGFDPIPQQIAVRIADGAPRASVQRTLRRTFPQSYSRPVPSTALRNLGRLRGLPWTLVVMLAALAVGVTLHALVTAISRRRHELAILRALGFTARNTRASLLWQTSALGAVAAVVGVPLGVMVGRLGWRAITYSNGLAGGAVVPAVAIVVAGFLALAVPLLLVVAPAIRESRRGLGTTLRVE